MNAARVCLQLCVGAAIAWSAGAVLAHVPGVVGEGAGVDAAPVSGLALWSIDPWSALMLTFAAAWYGRGRARVFRRGRGVRMQRPGEARDAALFWAGWATLVIALGPPLDPLGGWLFSAHMLQHEILMLVSAPLLVLSRPAAYLLWGMPRIGRVLFRRLNRRAAWRRGGAWLISPPGAWIVHATMLWGWHLPYLFEASLRSDAMHVAQHTGFFVSALLFWQALLMSRDPRRTTGAVVYLFTTALHSGVLGAIMTFAPTPWYAPYLPTTTHFGLSALEDQQLGGLIMWIPSGVVFLVAGLVMVARALRDVPAESARGPVPQPAPLVYARDRERRDD